ncbi:hypothetical protein Noda2021_05900 [Candidatus Dependentiae bacterium Noda2021]|nr:hypothetical protein Noda2021_05900 [Candidatus Dependentiae bacterium Noda2021]
MQACVRHRQYGYYKNVSYSFVHYTHSLIPDSCFQNCSMTAFIASRKEVKKAWSVDQAFFQ